MSLTMGMGPFGHQPAGRFNVEIPILDGHVSFAWDDLDAWFEEDEQLLSHAIDPYHRIDVRPTSRHVVVAANGVTLADSRRAAVLFETGLPPRWYLPREDVLVALEPTELHTTCVTASASSRNPSTSTSTASARSAR